MQHMLRRAPMMGLQCLLLMYWEQQTTSLGAAA